MSHSETLHAREYMVHRSSGDIFVMEFAGGSDEPIAMIGPCYYGDIETVRMDDWNLEQADLEWAAGESWAVCETSFQNWCQNPL